MRLPKDIVKDIMLNLRDARLRKGMSIANLSALTGVSVVTILHYEGGKTVAMPVRVLVTLLKALDVQPNDIIKMEECKDE